MADVYRGSDDIPPDVRWLRKANGAIDRSRVWRDWWCGRNAHQTLVAKLRLIGPWGDHIGITRSDSSIEVSASSRKVSRIYDQLIESGVDSDDLPKDLREALTELLEAVFEATSLELGLPNPPALPASVTKTHHL